MRNSSFYLHKEYKKWNAKNTLIIGRYISSIFLAIYTAVFIIHTSIIKLPVEITSLLIGFSTSIIFTIAAFTFLKSNKKYITFLYALFFSGITLSFCGSIYEVFIHEGIQVPIKYEMIILFIVLSYSQSAFSFGLRKYLYLIQLIPVCILIILLNSQSVITFLEWIFLINLPIVISIIYLKSRYTERKSFNDFVYAKKIESNKIELQEEVEKRKTIENDLLKHEEHLKQLVQERTQHIKDKSKELEIAKDKAEESDRLKTSFMATMSHELRTPLNAIIGFTELIDEDTSEEEIFEYKDIINKSGIRLLTTVEDIFQLTYIETKEINFKKVQFNLNEFLTNLLDKYEEEKQLFHKQYLQIKFIPGSEDKECFIQSDPRHIKNIFDKLVNNAIKFTNIGSISIGYKLIRAEKNQSKVIFHVKDTGIGIDPKFHKIIFERFRQVEETNTRNYEGSGLGTTIAKELVEYLKGKIWIESEIDKGTSFYFSIPIDIEERSAEQVEIKTKKALKDLSKYRILVAEDTESNFKLIEQILKKTKVEIIWAMDGLEAVEFCKTDDKIDLILMDMKMPNMNGYEATQEIKKINKEIPIIAQTAYALQDDESKAFTNGCDDYIAKPIRARELMDAIHKHLPS